MPNIEIDLETLNSSYDWEEVFGEGSGGNTTNETNVVPLGSLMNNSPPSRSDVAEIIAAVNGENDGVEWVGVFRLKDGRYLVAEGSCDYTGWDCQAGNSLTVAATMEDILAFGLTESQKVRLGL